MRQLEKRIDPHLDVGLAGTQDDLRGHHVMIGNGRRDVAEYLLFPHPGDRVGHLKNVFTILHAGAGGKRGRETERCNHRERIRGHSLPADSTISAAESCEAESARGRRISEILHEGAQLGTGVVFDFEHQQNRPLQHQVIVVV